MTDDDRLEIAPEATILPIRKDGERPALHAPGASLLVSVEGDGGELLDTRFLHIGGIGTMPRCSGSYQSTSFLMYEPTVPPFQQPISAMSGQ